MPIDKAELAREFFNQIESQVQFGDQKASLLVAGDALLLAISGGFTKFVSDSQAGEQAGLTDPTLAFALSITAVLLLVTSLACALWAARPSAKHRGKAEEFFLLSYVARISKEKFAEEYRSASDDDLLAEVLTTIHGKARYAASKFRLVGYAIDVALLSLMSLLAAMMTLLISGLT